MSGVAIEVAIGPMPQPTVSRIVAEKQLNRITLTQRERKEGFIVHLSAWKSGSTLFLSCICKQTESTTTETRLATFFCGLSGRAVKPGLPGLVLVKRLHSSDACPAYDSFALGGAGAGLRLDVAGGDGEEQATGGIDHLALAVFGDHVVEVGLGRFELLHLRIEVGVVGFDVGAVGVVDDAFGGYDEGVAEGNLVGLGGRLGQEEDRC